MVIFLWSIVISIFLVVSISAQESTKDTATVLPDAFQRDTTIVKQDEASVTGVDTIVTYSCNDSLVYFIPTKTMSMYDESKVRYQNMELKAAYVDFNWQTSILTARGKKDSTEADTGDSLSITVRGRPVMKDGDEEYHGDELSYNFKTKKGKINVGDTHVGEGFYHGADIKRIDRNVLFVADGRYTTCDRSTPHYYFFSHKMKITLKDHVVAEPVYLYIADVPVFVLPFAVFPNKSGRRSGIIAPAYGEDATRGRFLRHFGYYWAMNDYMDISLKGDWFTKGGWTAYGDYRYALRYSFVGSLSGEYRRLLSGEKGDPRRTEEDSYRLNIFHNQDIDPTMRLSANFTFTSNNAFRNTIEIGQALNQSISSNATLSKYWEGTPNSISLNISRNQNLIDGSIYEDLPSISFNHSQSYPFRRKSSTDPSMMNWYEMISVSYGVQASNAREKINRKIGGIKVTIDERDTVQTVEEYERSSRQLVSQNIGLGISPKVGYFTIMPSMSYRDERKFSDVDFPERAPSDSSLIFKKMRSSGRAGFLSSGVGATTKLYGILQPNMLGVQAFRHTLTPSLSFTYSKQIVGEDPLGRQMFISFGAGNNFEMKTIAEEEGKEGTKIQLLNAGTGISYNFTQDSLRFSPISVNYRTGIGNALNCDGEVRFDLYQLVQTSPNTYVRVNKFLLKEEGRLARLTDFRINVSTSLSGERKTSAEPASEDTADALQKQFSKYKGPYEREEPNFNIPWRLSLSFNYSENKVPPLRSRQASIRGDLDFNLTEKWKFAVRGGYDITNKEIVFPEVSISRDLHCWIMNFYWVPLGGYQQYRFEIRIKSSQLQDIKVTKQGSERGIY